MLNIRTAADVRAEVARGKVKLYRVAARAGLHPARLSLIINDHVALTPELADRLAEAISQELREVPGDGGPPNPKCAA
jgi:hypothetical protein